MLKIPAHTHIADTDWGKATLAGLPDHILSEPSRKRFPIKTPWRQIWERYKTFLENKTTRALNTCAKFSPFTWWNRIHLDTAALYSAVSYRDFLLLDMKGHFRLGTPTGYVTFWRRHRVREFVNCERCEQFLHNKILTKRYLSFCGISQCAPLIAIIDGIPYAMPSLTRYASLQDAVATIINMPFIVKGTTGRFGAENTVCTKGLPDANRCITFIEGAMNKGASRSFLIEALIGSDATPYGITNSLNTLRLTTWRQISGTIKIIGAAQRLAVKYDSVDNWATGGLAANIDLHSGLVEGPYYSKHLGPQPDHRLPQPFTVPNWTSIKELVCKAHGCFPGLTSVGWDVANTTTGPLIVEGNHDWDIYMHQWLTRKGFEFD